MAKYKRYSGTGSNKNFPVRMPEWMKERLDEEYMALETRVSKNTILLNWIERGMKSALMSNLVANAITNKRRFYTEEGVSLDALCKSLGAEKTVLSDKTLYRFPDKSLITTDNLEWHV